MNLKFIDELTSETKVGDSCHITGRVCSIRNHGNVSFLDLKDYTGKIQIVVEKNKHNDSFKELSDIPVGSYISVGGKYLNNKRGDPEINANSLEILALATLQLSPNPWEIDGIDPKHGFQVFSFPDFYIASPKRAAVLKVKTNFINALHNYFQDHKFTLVEPPILTDKTLYDEQTAVKANVHGEDVYLTQCATFELEPLALAFGKVYTISPAFRNEKSGSKRHLTEYTHAKAEILLADIEDLMHLAEECLYSSIKKMKLGNEKELNILERDIDVDLLKPGRPGRITYDDAIRIVRS